MAQQEVNGVRLYYEEQGSGAPILCIHAAGSSAVLWRDAVQKRFDLGQALLVKLGAPALVQNAGGEPAPHEGTLAANMLVGHG